MNVVGAHHGVLLGAAAAWTPAKSTGEGDVLPALWLRADAGITYGVSPKIEAWADQSINGWDFGQATAAYQPSLVADQLNGLPAVQFTASLNTFLASAAVISLPANAISLFYAGRIQTGGAYQYVVGCATDKYIYVGAIEDKAAVFHGNGAAWNFVGKLSPLVDMATYLLFDYVNSGTTQAYHNGMAFTPNADPVAEITNLVFHLGCNDGKTQFSNAAICELIFYGSALSLTDRVQVRTYLSARFGIPL